MADNPAFSLIAAAAIIGGSLLITTMGGCDVSREDTVRILSKQGYTNIRTTGHAWFACDSKDQFGSNFTAVTKDGQPITGSICSGWLKNYTVRYD